MFNHIASEQLLNYFGISRGIMSKHHADSIDPKTVNALTARGVPLSESLRSPKALKALDFEGTDLIVLISGNELASRIMQSEQMEGKELVVWNFNNAGSLSPSELFPALEAEVYLLVRRLQQHQYVYQQNISA